MVTDGADLCRRVAGVLDTSDFVKKAYSNRAAHKITLLLVEGHQIACSGYKRLSVAKRPNAVKVLAETNELVEVSWSSRLCWTCCLVGLLLSVCCRGVGATGCDS